MSEKLYSKSDSFDESDDSQENEEAALVFEIEASLEYLFKGLQGEATGYLYKEYMLLKQPLHSEFTLKYREIIGIKGENYRIYITCASGEELIISCLGYSYEDFLRILIKNRNELILQDMLMYESKIFMEAEGEYIHRDDSGSELSSGECIMRLYETGLIIIPNTSNPFRIPYSLISKFNEDNHRLYIETDIGECIILSQIGLALEGLKHTYTELITKLDKRLQPTIQNLFKETSSSLFTQLTMLIRDGKSAKKEDLDSLKVDLWPQMEFRLKSLGLSEEYDYLKSMSHENKISIGLKKGLMGDLTSEYIWFLVPIYALTPVPFGNIIAMEAVSKEGEGKATYFFKIMERAAFNKLQSLEELHKHVDRFIKLLNYSMLQINFRREPIYLSTEQLSSPQYLKYMYAIEAQPALKLMRKHFVGRVIHSSMEQWKQDVMDLIKFNTTEEADSKVWKRNK